MDTRTYPGRGLSLSQLVFSLNEELKHAAYSLLCVAKDHMDSRGLKGQYGDFLYLRLHLRWCLSTRPRRFGRAGEYPRVGELFHLHKLCSVGYPFPHPHPSPFSEGPFTR